MTRHDAAMLAIRLAAVYSWIQGLEFVATGAIGYLFSQSKIFGGASPLAGLVFILPCVAMFAAGLFLWLRAPALSRHFVSAHPEPITFAGSSSAASLAFAVIGLAVFLYALPHIVSECITLMHSDHFVGREAAPELVRHLPALVGGIVQLICGFLLFVRPHRLARWWERRRDAKVSV